MMTPSRWAPRWLALPLLGAALHGQTTADTTWPTDGAGAPPSHHASLELSPNLTVDLSTGNLLLQVAAARLDEDNLPPIHDLVLSFNNRRPDATGGDGGWGLGPGWCTSLGDRLDFVAADAIRLDEGDGTQVDFSDQGGSWSPAPGSFLTLEADAGGWVVRRPDRSERRFDVTGRLVALASPEGNVHPVTWSSGAIVWSEEPTGRRLNTQSVSGRVEQLVLGGYVWQLTHHADGRLASVVDPWFGTQSFTYDGDGRIAAFTDLGGHTWQFAYATSPLAEGRLASVTDPAAETLSLTYVFGAQTLRTELTDRRGEVWKWVHRRAFPGALKRSTDPLGHTWRHIRDGNGLLTRLTSPLGRTWSWTHDAAGRVLSLQDPRDDSVTYTYDALGNLASRSVGGSTIEWHHEDPRFPTLVTRRVGPVDADGQRATTVRTYHGPADGPIPGSWNGRLASVTDALGVETRFTYGDRGALLTMEEGPDGAPGSVLLSWASGTRVEHLSQGGMLTPAGFPQRPAPPAAVQGDLDVVSERRATWWGAPASETYDVAVPLDAGQGPESSAGSRTYTYDHRQRLVAVDVQTDEPLAHVAAPPNPVPVRSYTATHHDSSPQARLTLDTPDGQSVDVFHEAVGRIEHVTTGAGSAEPFDATLAYDADGRLTSITHASGASSHFTWFDDDQPWIRDHRVGGTSVLRLEFDWDERDLLRSVDETGLAGTLHHGFDHDDRGRLLREERLDVTSGQQLEVTYTYDAVGNRKQRELRLDGQLIETVEYHHDLDDPAAFGSRNHRLVRIERSDGFGQPTSTSWCFYDNPYGHLSEIVTRAAGSTHTTATSIRYAAPIGTPWLIWDSSWQDTGSGPTSVTVDEVVELRQLDVRPHLLRRRDPQTWQPLPGGTWTDGLGGLRSAYSVDPSDGSVTMQELRHLGLGGLDVDGVLQFAGDHRGAVRMALRGSSLSTAEYTAFGERASSSFEPYGTGGLMGHQQALQGGTLGAARLVSAGWRLLAPDLGRFVMRDPIGLFGGLNTYAYVTNRPTSLVDPTGMSPVPHGGAYRGPAEGPRTAPSPDTRIIIPDIEIPMPPDPNGPPYPRWPWLPAGAFSKPEYHGPPATPPPPYRGPGQPPGPSQPVIPPEA